MLKIYIYPLGDETSTVYIQRKEGSEVFDSYNRGKRTNWYVESYIKTLAVKAFQLPLLEIKNPLPTNADKGQLS